MKVLSLSLLVLFIGLLASCKKDSNGAGNTIQGKWLWRSSQGGFAGQIIKPSQNEEAALEFDNNSYYKYLVNDTFRLNETYRIYIDSAKVTMLHFDGLKGLLQIPFSGDPAVAKVSEDSLVLQDRFADGYVHYFIRKK